MNMNLYGEVIPSLDDVADMMTVRGIRNGIHELRLFDREAKSSYRLYPRTEFSLYSVPGFYSIFKDTTLEYIGMADGTTLGDRLGKFTKEVNGMSRPTEEHKGGNRWRFYHGARNFEGCKVMFSEYLPHEAARNKYTYKQIEARLIQLHKPRFNRMLGI
jgi:hypothetical protein